VRFVPVADGSFRRETGAVRAFSDGAGANLGRLRNWRGPPENLMPGWDSYSEWADPQRGNDLRCGLDSAQLRLGGVTLGYWSGFLGYEYFLFHGHWGVS